MRHFPVLSTCMLELLGRNAAHHPARERGHRKHLKSHLLLENHFDIFSWFGRCATEDMFSCFVAMVILHFNLILTKLHRPGFTYLEGDLQIYCNVSDDNDGGPGVVKFKMAMGFHMDYQQNAVDRDRKNMGRRLILTIQLVAKCCKKTWFFFTSPRLSEHLAKLIRTGLPEQNDP